MPTRFPRSALALVLALTSGCSAAVPPGSTICPTPTHTASAGAPDAGPPRATSAPLRPEDTALSDAGPGRAQYSSSMVSVARMWRARGRFADFTRALLSAVSPAGVGDANGVDRAFLQFSVSVSSTRSTEFPSDPRGDAFLEEALALGRRVGPVPRGTEAVRALGGGPLAQELSALLARCPVVAQRDRVVFTLPEELPEGVDPMALLEQSLAADLQRAGRAPEGFRSLWVHPRVAVAMGVRAQDRTIVLDAWADPLAVCRRGDSERSAFEPRARADLATTPAGADASLAPLGEDYEFGLLTVNPAQVARRVALEGVGNGLVAVGYNRADDAPSIDPVTRAGLVLDGLHEVASEHDLLAPGGRPEFSVITGRVRAEERTAIEIRATPSDAAAVFGDPAAWEPTASVRPAGVGTQGFVQARTAWLASGGLGRFDPAHAARISHYGRGNEAVALAPRVLAAEAHAVLAEAGPPAGLSWSDALQKFERVGVANVGARDAAVVSFGVLPAAATEATARCVLVPQGARCRARGAGVLVPGATSEQGAGRFVRLVQAGARWVLASSASRAALESVSFEPVTEPLDALAGEFPASESQALEESARYRSLVAVQVWGSFSMGLADGALRVTYSRPTLESAP